MVPSREGMLREVMARGVDRAILVSAREFGGSILTHLSDLAAAIDKIGIDKDDIVMCGRQAIDGHRQVAPDRREAGPARCLRREITKEGDTITVKRMLETAT